MRKTAISAARKAGKLLMRSFGKPVPGIREKHHGSLVSSLDIRCNDLIIRDIRGRFPEHNIITEESPPIDNKSEYTWFVDPVDGTHNYLRGLPLFGVSIALAKSDTVILGVIYLPFFDRMYVAEKGKGARCNGKRIRVSRKKDIDLSFILFDSSMSARRKKLRFMDRIASRIFNERVFGCAVYVAAAVADGTSDALIIFKTNSWDIAAGFLLIEEAGGKVTSLAGERWTPFQSSYVAGNPQLHRKLLALL